jgi:hypothetical protein
MRVGELYAGGQQFRLVIQSPREGGRNDVRTLINCLNGHGERDLADELDEALNPDRHHTRPTLRYDLDTEQTRIIADALQTCATRQPLPQPLQQLSTFLANQR